MHRVAQGRVGARPGNDPVHVPMALLADVRHQGANVQAGFIESSIRAAGPRSANATPMLRPGSPGGKSARHRSLPVPDVSHLLVVRERPAPTGVDAIDGLRRSEPGLDQHACHSHP
jgi:hypothetical protein